MRAILFATLCLQALLAASLIATLVRPSFRVWPPPSTRSWKFWFTWLGTWAHLSGTFFLGVLAWGSLQLPFALRYGVGAPLLAAGFLSVFWGFRVLTASATLGLEGQLIHGGPYRFSRNPQYVSSFAILLGWALLSASPGAICGSLGASTWYFLAPFVEESWLRSRFGAEYEAYMRRVPRFLGPRIGRAAA